ncbi:MAG: hypothetical protein GEU99_09360 [Luteitalea sp.]|nr:hypothetical protein [Luteitalea sp.]
MERHTTLWRRLVCVCAPAILSWGLFAAPGAAQQRPLVTEDPETIGSGNILIEAGADYGRDVFYPASGLTGNRLRLPTLGLSIGLSSIAELQFDTGPHTRLSITEREDAPFTNDLEIDGTSTRSFDDTLVGLKMRLVGEGPDRPAFGVRLATRLSTASKSSGLGLATTDFLVQALAAKTTQSTRVVGNVGVAWLGNPVGGEQNTAFLYGASLANAVAPGLEIVGELNGRFDTGETPAPAGTESRSALRAGLRHTHGPGRIDGGIILGLTDNEPGFGFTIGYTYVFHAFAVP